jgi:hypothetical protein
MLRIRTVALTVLALSVLVGAERVRDIVYGRKLGMALTMDVWKPAKQNAIGVIFLVNGGFQSGLDKVDSERVGAVVLNPFLDHGQTVFAVSHSAQQERRS